MLSPLLLIFIFSKSINIFLAQNNTCKSKNKPILGSFCVVCACMRVCASAISREIEKWLYWMVYEVQTKMRNAGY